MTAVLHFTGASAYGLVSCELITDITLKCLDLFAAETVILLFYIFLLVHQLKIYC